MVSDARVACSGDSIQILAATSQNQAAVPAPGGQLNVRTCSHSLPRIDLGGCNRQTKDQAPLGVSHEPSQSFEGEGAALQAQEYLRGISHELQPAMSVIASA